jgi:hypothetical protein
MTIIEINYGKIKLNFLATGGGLGDSKIKIWDYSNFNIRLDLIKVAELEGHRKTITKL